jgi:hypothetical protein
MKPVDKSELLDLGSYEQIRDRFRARVIEEKRRRRVAVGGNLTVLFENHDTVLFQIQEMLRTERISEPSAVQHEIDTYNTLVPSEHELSATIFVEYPDKEERDRMLVSLAGIEDAFYVAVAGQRVTGRAEMRGERTDRTTAVHYVRFALGKELADKARQGGALSVGVDHAEYRAETPLTGPVRDCLLQDLAQD